MRYQRLGLYSVARRPCPSQHRAPKTMQHHCKYMNQRGQKRPPPPGQPGEQRGLHSVRPPRTSRHPRAHPDSFALVPASALPYKARWEGLARSLPPGSVLLIAPPAGSPLSETLETIVAQLEARGHRVTVVPAERFGS